MPLEKEVGGSGGGGGPGEFTPESTVTGTIASGSSGDILTISCPTGKRIRLTWLANQVVASPETGITVSAGGNDVLSSIDIDRDASQVQIAAGALTIGIYGGDSISPLPNGVLGPVDQNMVIKKDTGPTANDMYYVYQIGV